MGDPQRPASSRPANRLLTVVATVLVVAAPAWAGWMASRSPSWEPACYRQNICDSLTFTVVAESLAEGKTPYVESVRREHIARTRLGGEPSFDLPFQYPPNALPLFAWRARISPRVAKVVMAFGGTLLFMLPFMALVCERVRVGPAVLLMVGVSTSAFVASTPSSGRRACSPPRW